MAGPVTPALLPSSTDFDNTTSSGLQKKAAVNQSSYASSYLDNDVTHLLWLTVPPVLLVLGCYGNVMTVLVMRRMRASESTACLSVYFTALAVSDLFLLCTTVIYYWSEFAFNTPLGYFHDLSCSLPYYVSYVSSMTSAWFLVAMTCQRLTSVVVPHRVGVLCTVRRGKIITASIVIVSCAINTNILFIYHTEQAEVGYQVCLYTDEDLAGIFTLLDLCLASVIPFLFLIVANAVLICRALRSLRMAGKMTAGDRRQTSSRSARVSSMTTTLVLTSVAFLVLTLPTCILDVYLEESGYYEGKIADDEELNQKLTLADTVCMLLWMSNSAFNFYLYILSGSRFRQETRRCLGRWCVRPAKTLAGVALKGH